MKNTTSNAPVFGQLAYRDGNPLIGPNTYKYPLTLEGVYKMHVGSGPVDVPRLLTVLESEICSPAGKTRGLREELLTTFLAVRDLGERESATNDDDLDDDGSCPHGCTCCAP
jgi:hypothetical protein